VDPEGVYKRNKLLIEHVMLGRAQQRLKTRQERKEARQKGKEQPTMDWKVRQELSNQIFAKQRKGLLTEAPRKAQL